MKRNKTSYKILKRLIILLITVFEIGYANPVKVLSQTNSGDKEDKYFEIGEDFNPESPEDPEGIPSHTLTFVSNPENKASLRPSSRSRYKEGSIINLQVIPNEGWVINSWVIDGERRDIKNNSLQVTMGTKPINVKVNLSFNPQSPINPSRNYYNSETGEMIVDDFKPGELGTMIYELLNYTSGNDVTSISVKGEIEEQDYSAPYYCYNVGSLDFSRTGGGFSVPSYAFSGLSNLNTVIFPMDVNNFGKYVFEGCHNLASMVIYAFAPPKCSYDTFYGIEKSNVSVYVPASSIALYYDNEDWKDFILLPINDKSHDLQVNLPSECKDGRYKNYSIELVNLKTNVKQKYVVSDRLTYTFHGLLEDEKYVVYLLSQAGIEIGKIPNIIMHDKDLEVGFSDLATLHTVTAKVTDPSGNVITEGFYIEWLKPNFDGSTTYLKKSNTIAEMPEGQELICRVSLNESLGTTYHNPGETICKVLNSDNILNLKLSPFKKVQILGQVKNVSGNGIAEATVSAKQLLNGIYSKTFTSKSDKNGRWKLEVLDVPETELTFSATDYVNCNQEFDFDYNVFPFDCGEITLEEIIGGKIKYSFTYQSAGEDNIDNYYPDFQNVFISAYNLTQGMEVKEVSQQFPWIVLQDPYLLCGDKIRLTATSKSNSFNSVENIVELNENLTGEVVFNIVEKGGIEAIIVSTENPAVIAMLYDSKGNLLKKKDFSNGALSFPNLDNGSYYLVTMGKSNIVNAINKLTLFEELQLEEGKDYVSNKIDVESGEIKEIKIPMVPLFDDTQFYFTTSASGFSSNKTNVTSGNYFTLKAQINFKDAYKNNISDVELIVNLPENAVLIENSAIQGTHLLQYTYDDQNRIVIYLGQDYKNEIRFCVMPTQGGEFNATASISFMTENKTVNQPLGTATVNVKDLELVVPSLVTAPEYYVSGYAPPKSKIEIFDGNDLVGTGTTNLQGTYRVLCHIPNPYNLSEHNIHAKITTIDNQLLKSQTKEFKYNINAVKILSVVMTEGSNRVLFDFEEPDKEDKYYYYSFGRFTFVINFNRPREVNNVLLYVHTTDGSIRAFPASYDEEKNIWFVAADFDTNALPLNVSIDFDLNIINHFDSNLFNQAFEGDLNDLVENTNQKKQEINELENICDKELEDLENELNTLEDLTSVLLADITSEEIYNENLIKFLSTVNPGFQPSDIEIEEKEVYTEAEIEQLLARGEALLKEERYSNEELNKKILAADKFLKELNEEWDQESSLDVDSFEQLSFEFEDENYIAAQLSDEELAKYDFSFYEMIPLTLTDGSMIKIFTLQDEWIIVNESCNKAFLVRPEISSPFALYGVRENTIAFLQNLRDEFNIANQKMIGIISDLTEGFRNDVKRLEEFVRDLEGNNIELNAKSAAKGQKVAEIERQLKELKAAGKGSFKQMDLEAQRMALNNERKALIREIEQINKDLKPVKNSLKSFKVKLAAANALLSEAMDYWQIVDGFVCIIRYIGSAIADYFRWSSFIDSILPCNDDYELAVQVRSLSIDNRARALRGYIAGFTLAGLSEAISVALKVSSKLSAAGWALKFLCGALSGALLETAKGIYTEVSTDSHNDINSRIKERNALKCKKNDPYDYPFYYPDDPSDPQNDPRPNPDGGKHKSNNGDSKYGIDPSGFVYEAVPENRVEGVQASIYYKETKENMYGDLYDEEFLWNAEEYAQENPLFTDENGMYRWDVPQGLWQVRFEKEGYEPTQSEWLPVPPPQLDVNIPIVQNIQPRVIEAHAYKDGVDIQFDKFMNLSTLNINNIFVTANGLKLNGEIKYIDTQLADQYASEDDEHALRYASRVRFVPEKPLSTTTGSVVLTVSKNVKSYAELAMENIYIQELDIEKEIQEILADDINVLYGSEKTVTVFASPYDAAVGKILKIENSSSLVASLDAENLEFDEDGKVTFSVKGDLPGVSRLQFSIEDVYVKGECMVNVVTEFLSPSNPIASRLSGTKVYRGTTITLTTDSKNAIIYYTLDGSCPCDENSRLIYTEPIVINGDTKILAMAYDPDMEDEYSDTVEFNYTLKHSEMEYHLEAGYNWISHNLESAVNAREFINKDSGMKTILSHTDEIIRDPKAGVVGTLITLEPDQAYKVEMDKAGQPIYLTDIARNPSLPIKVYEGYNWISYPMEQVMTLNEALAMTDAEYEDMVIGKDGVASFDGQKWIGSLDIMSPGQGYLYLSKNEKNIVYNANLVSKANALYGVSKINNSAWVADKSKYASVMPMVADIYRKDGSLAEEGDYEIAAFCESECRGVGKYNNGYVFINIYGNNGDIIEFMLLENGSEQPILLPFEEKFTEIPLGSLSTPYEFRLDAAGINNVEVDSKIAIIIRERNLYVIGNEVRTVAIYDLAGNKLLHRDKVGESSIPLAGLVSGVYLVAVNNSGHWSYHKIMLK